MEEIWLSAPASHGDSSWGEEAPCCILAGSAEGLIHTLSPSKPGSISPSQPAASLLPTTPTPRGGSSIPNSGSWEQTRAASPSLPPACAWMLSAKAKPTQALLSLSPGFLLQFTKV